MTQDTYLASPRAEKTDEPPLYDDEERIAWSLRFTEKTTAPSCPEHSPTPTPLLDAHLSKPSAKAAAHTLTTAIDSTTDGAHCTRCTANEAARTLTRYLFELRHAKKAGGMSKEEKKAAKAELKGLMREVKAVVREEKGKLRREGGKD